MKSLKSLSVMALLSFSMVASAETFLLAGKGRSMSSVIAKRQSIEALHLKISHFEEECLAKGMLFGVLNVRDSIRTRVGSTYIYTTFAEVECE